MSIPNNPLNFEGTGIWVGNSYYLKNTTTPPNLQIFENDFGSLLDLAGQPRIGIFVSLANTPIVQNNHIYFDHSTAPSVPTLGIWMQNTQNAYINGNDIINTPTSGSLTNLFLGIRSDRNLTPCISDNTIDYLGNSIQFLGDHGQVSLSKNKMHFYDNAISLIGADIGVQGFFDINTSDSRSDENEFHHTNTGLQPDRVIGTTGNNLAVTWYFNSSNNQIENPDINNSISPFLLDEQGVNPNLDAIDCPLITDPVARNMAYGSVVGDSARYEENYYDFFYQNSRANLYSILKSDIFLLNMEDEADSSFGAFYNTMNASNIEKFDSVRSQIEIGDYASALQILNSINDSINFESVLKNVLMICLNRSIVDSSLTSNDSTTFYEVANENQLLYGESSIIARNWLFYEVHDGGIGQESRISNSNEKLNTSFEVSIFPNPTTDNLNFKYKEIIPDHITLLDVNQKLILNSININQLNLKNIEGGVYIIQFIIDGKIVLTNKIVKL
ncbi:MAG: T9SS type A sorting domain-containing protein [Bacteroidetes bacterium]|nr:T9SS type A sorting domain-containing protein [Bacteroidota bacterium]